MKKILTFICSLALVPLLALGQLNANRTANTKVSDALAMLPAQNAEVLNFAIEDLVSSGAEGITILTGMFDDVNNVPVNYALNGMAMYLTYPGREHAKQVFEQGILSALAKSTDTEVRRFYLYLLSIAGTDASLPALTSLIRDRQLGLPALYTIGTMKTPAAKEVIKQTILSGQGDKTALAGIAGYMKIEGIYPVLESWLDGADGELRNSVYYAMAHGGDVRALATIGKAAAAENYSTEKVSATACYLVALDAFKESANAEVVKRARELMNKTKSSDDQTLRVAAMEVYMNAGGKGYNEVIVKAMDDADRLYRAGVLNAASELADEGLYRQLLAKAAKMKNNRATADIIYFLGESANPSLTPQLIPYIASADNETSIAAMEAVTKLGGADVPQALALELKKGLSFEKLDAATKSLLAYDGDVTSVAAGVVTDPESTHEGKLSALHILDSKKATAYSELIFSLTGDQALSSAAHQILPNVVTPNDLPRLFEMLENTTDVPKIYNIQEAISNVVKNSPTGYATVKEKMDRTAKKGLYFVPLAATGNAEALRIISQGYANGNSADKREAVKALINWNGTQALEYLYAIARDDKNTEALTGYIDAAVNSELTPERKLILLSAAADITEDRTLVRRIVSESGKLPIFQSLIFTGNFLSSADATIRDRAAQGVMNIALANEDWNGPVVSDLLQKASAALTNPDADYHRQAIAKYLSEMPEGSGFVSIFNGTDLTGWKGIVDNPIARARMTEAQLATRQKAADEMMRQNWTVENGSIVYIGNGYDNICTTEDYGDFEMYIDWRVYPEDLEADGGLYLRGTPQVQIWRTDRPNVGSEVGSGGLYNNSVHPSKPLVVADNPTGEWNTFRIVMKGDRVSVWLNGDLVTDNVVLENYWDRKMPLFPTGQIELQGHDTRIAHRNIYIREFPAVEPYQVSAQEKTEGFVELFDGISLDQWYGNTSDYVAQDGAIVLHPSDGHGGNLYTKEEYGDFVLRFEFQLAPGTNNGIGIRTPDEGDAAYVGMEVQVLDDTAPIYSNLEQWQYHGSVYGIIAARRGHLKPVGEWNYEEIYIKGNDIRVTLNGVVIVEGNLAQASANGTLDGRNHPGLKNEKGHIAFLGHGSHVKFRNLRIKTLD